MRLSRVHCSATLDVSDGGQLPTEFLIFRAGKNPSSKGDFLFDAAAAKSVLAYAAKAGTDIMIDREHDSLNEEARKSRSDAGDAMGWGKLELRADGSLWMVAVRWGAEGEQRLREKRSRYISPAFVRDEEGRVCELINVGLVAMPALCDAPPLVAANRAVADKKDQAMRLVGVAIMALSKKRGAPRAAASHPKCKASSAKR